MKLEIKVPAGGESVTEATIAQLLVPSGTFVAKDAELVELETDKVNQVLYAPEAGVVTWNVKVDDVVKVGQVLGAVDTAGQGTPAPVAPQAPEPKKPPVAPSGVSEGVRKSPDDYIATLSEKKTAPVIPPTPKTPLVSGERKRMSGLRRTIAKKLVEVKNQTAMLTSFNEVDMSQVMAIRASEKEDFEKKYGVRLGFMSFFIKAVSQALKAFPDVGAFIDGDDMIMNKDHHIGISVSTDKGLMVPVIRNCQDKGFATLEKELVEYAKRAREGKISVDDLQGGIFTITNGGVFGSLLSTPILNPPQSAILGMHNIVKRPVVVDDQIVIRPMMYLALSYDHRVIDGKEAVQFLVHVKESLEEPARLLLDF